MFTFARHIEQAKNRLLKGKARIYSEHCVEGEAVIQEEPTDIVLKKTLRSSLVEETFTPSTSRPRPSSSVSTAPASRSKHVLPHQCIICLKVKKRIVDRIKKTRILEKLVTCETKGDTFLEAARFRSSQYNDKAAERIFLQIGDRDPVCIEVKYHKSCFSTFIRCLYKSTESKQKKLGKSFDVFCETVIQSRIIENGEVFRLTKLIDLFVSIVEREENIILDDYRTYQLKKRLTKKYSTDLYYL